MKLILKRIFDVLGLPLSLLTILWSKVITKSTERTMPFSNKLFRALGVRPVRDHYYEPMINPQKHLTAPLDQDRVLPGINMNIEGQLQLLGKFSYTNELLLFPSAKTNKLEYYYNNGRFESGDAEYLYNMIRFFKPQKIIEIGSGMSTLMAINAIEYNKLENNDYTCKHICIEPYEMNWLEDVNVEVLRKKVEDIPMTIFNELGENDILFIDSSHIIRPQGDVLTEYLHILPVLNQGVIVHIHDIFTPKDYPAEWVLTEHRLWNEQYLLEAFLCNNNKFEIIGALNHLKHHHLNQLEDACPLLILNKNRQPGSFWIRAVN